MKVSVPRPCWTALAAQIAVAFCGISALALAPPAHGAMLLVPLAGDPPVARLARDHDALLVASRPRGLVVQGDRNALFWPLLHAGVLTIAAPAAYCGDRR